MTLTPKLRRRLHAFERAVREHEFKGAHHPNDWPAIDAAYERAKAKLIEAIEELQCPPPS